MRTHTRRPIVITLLIGITAVALLLSACAPSSPTSGTVAVECQVFHRSSSGERFEESIITLGPDSGTETLEYDDFLFSAQFFDDPGEGPSLALATSNRGTGQEITRQLYQIDRAQGLVNQFIGGHGFTGLNYVFHPGSTAELQYFCQVQ